MAVPGVDVAVIDRCCRALVLRQLVLVWLGLGVAGSHAATLPEDRADVMYHAYDGGGVSVTGPSVLVRKSVDDKVSVYGNYYVDMVSSASIDVLTQGSKYSEERTEYSVGVDYLVDRALLSAGYSQSSESDYEARTFNLGVSQTFFGDLTTLSMGYGQGDDTVGRNDPPSQDAAASEFEEALKRHRFSVGLSQILTRNWMLALNYESINDDGFLQNPYRQYRFVDDVNGEVTWAPENYPTTRNSDAVALRSIYYLPYRASLRAEGRWFQDNWGIKAKNFELRYTHPLSEVMLFEMKGRLYNQNQADFYSDLFDYMDPIGNEYRARDKELSTYKSFNFGFGLTYELGYNIPFVQKQSLGFYWDFMHFDFENYRNALLSKPGSELDATPAYNPGEEPAYSFQANVLRVFLSLYY